MDILKELEAAKKKLTDLGKERMRVEGMHSQLLEQLKGKGINSLEEGKAEVERLRVQREETEAEALALLEEFKEKFKLFL